MANYKVSLRYAISLLEMAKDKNNLEAISSDMEYIAAVVNSSNKLILMIESPVVRPELKFSVLKEIFAGKINQDSLHFIEFLIEKNREEFLRSIITKFFELKDEYLGIVNVNVKTSQPFTEKQTNQLKARFESMLGKKVRFNFNIDQSIIGGFVARIGDTVYDASISNQLSVLKKQFTKG